MAKYKLLLFDFDGTLADTASDIAWHVNGVLGEFGCPPQGLLEVKKAVGRGVHELLKELAPKLESSGRLEEAVASFKKRYAECPVLTTDLFPRARQVLSGPLRDFKKAVITNKPHDLTLAIMKKLSLEKVFDLVIGGGAGHPHKPDPSALLFSMRKLKESATSTLFIGDSVVDLEAAAAAGIDFAWVDYGYDSVASGYALKFSDPIEWAVLRNQ